MVEILPQNERPVATEKQVQVFNSLIDDLTNPIHAEPHGDISWSVSDAALGFRADLHIVGNTDGENVHVRSFTERCTNIEGITYQVTYLSDGITQKIAGSPFIDVALNESAPEKTKLDFLKKTVTPRVLNNTSIVKPATQETAEEVIKKLRKFYRHLKK